MLNVFQLNSILYDQDQKRITQGFGEKKPQIPTHTNLNNNQKIIKDAMNSFMS